MDYNNKLDDTLNASQILHLALQKMDGIIAINSEADLMSPKSDQVNFSESINSELQLVTREKANHVSSVYRANHSDHYPTNVSNHNKQDKLNRLLQELKEYSRDDQIQTDQGLRPINMKPTEIVSTSCDGLNNGNSNSTSNNPTPDSIESNSNSNTNNTSSTHDYVVPEDNGKHDQDRNANFLHQLGFSNEYHQTGSQTDRIVQLESVVNILRNQLANTEELFKKALITKKALEMSNCELLSAIDKLKLQLTHSESQYCMTKERVRKFEAENESFQTRLLEKETEISSLRLTMAKIVRATGYVLSDNELALLSGKTIASDFLKNKFQHLKEGESPSRPALCKNNTAFYSEPTSRRESVSTSLGGRASPLGPVRYHSAQPSPSSTPPARPSHHSRVPPRCSSPSANLPALRSTSAENLKMDSEQQGQRNGNTSELNAKHSDDKYVNSINKNPYSTLPYNSKAIRQIQQQLEENERNVELESKKRNPNEEIRQMSTSLLDEQLSSKAFSTPASPIINFKSSMHCPPPPQPSAAVTFAKDEEIIPSSLQSSTNELVRNGVATPARFMFEDSKPKGLRRIFSRKRSTSSLSGLADPFNRGGLRATSGPRLGGTPERKFINVNLPFSQWDTALVTDWFAMIGLGMYVHECRRWCRNGEHLMRATSVEVEKELGIRNNLHRKKLRLAVASMSDDEDQLLRNAGKLDYLWVARWLDDIGLPQYKDQFIDARVDGRVLHYLTVEDLLQLKVTSQLHFASIRSGIRILREQNFNGQCLKRRAAPEEVNQAEWLSSEVALWSSHRVMEWLRSIDLSEYAPNLRGSGVHGALILFESAFNADLFATLLSIPSTKTLLRRHISAKFKQLIGEDLNKVKRDYECMANYSPMIPGAKIKAHKKGFTLRKKRADFELTDYVCPMTPVISSRPSLTGSAKEAKSSDQSLGSQCGPINRSEECLPPNTLKISADQTDSASGTNCTYQEPALNGGDTNHLSSSNVTVDRSELD